MNISDTILSWFSCDIGIDLGTANTPVYLKGSGIKLREPSYVAIRPSINKVVAIGSEAKAMLGRTHNNIKLIRPLRDGVIADFDATEKMLRYLIAKVSSRGNLFGPRVIIGIPCGITEVEQIAVREAAIKAGARKALLIEQPLAAAIGAGLPVTGPSGSMVVDIGGGTTEVAVISLSGIVVSTSLRIAGDRFDEAIIQYVRRVYNLLIGERTAEEAKISVGSAYPQEDDNKSFVVKGKDLILGLPRQIPITCGEIREAISEPLRIIEEAVVTTLEKTPPELASDIHDHGIALTGGGSLLKGLDVMLSKATGIKFYPAPKTQDCVALGTGKLFEDEGLFNNIIFRKRKRYTSAI